MLLVDDFDRAILASSFDFQRIVVCQFSDGIYHLLNCLADLATPSIKDKISSELPPDAIPAKIFLTEKIVGIEQNKRW